MLFVFAEIYFQLNSHNLTKKNTKTKENKCFFNIILIIILSKKDRAHRDLERPFILHINLRYYYSNVNQLTSGSSSSSS